MPTYLTPGVYFESVDTADAVVPSIRTDIAAFVGIAGQGPLGQATPVQSWNQFQAAFGSFLPNAYLAYAVKAFFENGGQKAYVVRVAAPAATTTTNPAVPQPVDGSSSRVLSILGFTAGAVVTAQQTALAQSAGVQPADRQSSLVDTIEGFPQGSLVEITQAAPFFQAWHKVEGVDAAAKRLYWDSVLEPGFLLTSTLTLASFHQADLVVSQVNPLSSQLVWMNGLGPKFNLNQPIQFDTGVSNAGGVFNDSAGAGTLAVQASSRGSWGDTIAVSVSPSSLAATATSSVPQPASGSYSFVQSVVGFPRFSLVRVYQTQGVLPVIDYRTVTTVNPATNLLQWDSSLVPTFDVTKPISFETVEFGLNVYVNGRAQESFSGLSLNPSHPRYVQNVVNPRTLGCAAAGGHAFAIYPRDRPALRDYAPE